MTKQRIIVGISGASGVIYGIRLLELLRSTDIETHLIMSNSAEITLTYENNLKVADVKNLADVAHNVKDIAACLSSGSYRTFGMIIAPCSVRTMSEISSGVTSSLLTRSADVILKERRKLVLMVRETPLHTGHLRTMTNLSELGAIIAPPVPAFYAKPENLNDMVDYSLGRILDLFDIELPNMNRWDENSKKRPAH
ncbi:UbiX family flavin prenyltransferase [Kiloniella sp. EL199]|uniref:UbiX family flavin prenyltransferase n=1 Tax=Kiloniella sp. EL199 TaxID=2107581 RepID=UPI000EA0350D|nr:UbiX family flavin prenyltransferase [Kiloniella sp. EL199]